MSTKTVGHGKYDFVGAAPIFGGISLVLVLASLIYLGIHGIRYGIDFAGGTEIQVKFEKPVTIDELRTVVNKAQLINPQLQAFGEGSEFVVRFQTPEGATEKEVNEKQNVAVNNLRTGIETDLKSQVPEIRRVDSVGPQVGAELKRNGLLAVFYSLLVILIYVALRFDYKYAPGAVICLAHDAIITLALFVLVGKEVNVPILAAILTLIGFSLNDTIVVFDRIRETEGNFKSESTKFAINRAINDMLGRTIITSGTTFTSALCLWFFGVGDVADIAFALAVGIFFGTYSSIYVAAPLMILFEKVKLVQPTGVKARA